MSFKCFFRVACVVFGVSGVIQAGVIRDKLYQRREQMYDHIKKFLDQYTRPITVLELGPKDGYFSFRIAQGYDATCVMVDKDEKNVLFERCKKSEQDNIILLKEGLIDRAFKKVGECECPDVVVVLHDLHFRGNQQRGFEHILVIGDHCIVKVVDNPVCTEDNWYHNGKFKKILLSKGARVLVETFNNKGLRETIFLHSDIKKTIKKHRWVCGRLLNPTEYVITSTFYEKTLFKKRLNIQSSWVKGINLETYRVLNGIYPLRENILEQLKSFEHLEHNDLNICNMVIQGKKIVPIDFNDPRRDEDRDVKFNKLMHIFDKK